VGGAAWYARANFERVLFFGSGAVNARQNKKKALRAIDLFSGCGGMTVGLKRAGFAVIRFM
jgi:hypothetical protein